MKIIMNRKVSFISTLSITVCVLLGVLLITSTLYGETIPSPKEFFGFNMGDDGKLARWDKIVQYFQTLDKTSPRVSVKTLGPSTLGNPFIVAIFSSPDNLAKLDKYRKISKQLADPRGLSKEQIKALIKEGKYVAVQTYSLHATEVGGTQCTPELAYDLVSKNDPVTKMILDKTIFLMIPSFNPDGLKMVAEWFYKYKGTQFDHTRLPYLYHFYCGHDNNRDSYQLTQNESRMYGKLVYRDWVPQGFIDHHHFGGSGARFYIPPYYDPIHPNVDPLVWREHQLVGSHIAVALENHGKSGIESGLPFTAWWQASFHMSANYHNITGMLTESASADWADPVYVLPDQLGGTRGRPQYKAQMSMPRLWPGGWWRLRDIVEQQIIASKAFLELGARYKETMLGNMVRKAIGNIKRGKSGPPYGYVLPLDQHDFPTAVKLARIFQMNGVEIYTLEQDVQRGSRFFGKGSFVISCAQPMRAFIISFLEQVNYPDNFWTREHGTLEPRRPYDLSAFSMSEHMGVEALPLKQSLEGMALKKITQDILPPEGKVENGQVYLLEPRFNDTFKAMNRLFKAGAKVSRATGSFTANNKAFPAGTVIFHSKKDLSKETGAIAKELGVDIYGLAAAPKAKSVTIKQPRMGLYKRYAGGNKTQGWTAWLLKDFEFPFQYLFNKDMQNRKKMAAMDVIIIPGDSYKRIVKGKSDRSWRPDPDDSKIPPEYRGGIGEAGEKNVKHFVQNGGTLVVINTAWEFAQKVFELPVRNLVEETPRAKFFCPGSTVKIKVDTGHPLGYGMPADAFALFRDSPVLGVRTGEFKDGISLPVRYVEENILQSGWLIGEKHMSGKPAAVSFNVGKGKVVLLAFPVQHRAQMHGTFKIFFNAFYL